MQSIDLRLPSTSANHSISESLEHSKSELNELSNVSESESYFDITKKLHALSTVVQRQQREIDNQKRDLCTKTKHIEELQTLLSNANIMSDGASSQNDAFAHNPSTSVSVELVRPVVGTKKHAVYATSAPKSMSLQDSLSVPSATALADVSSSLNYSRKLSSNSIKSTNAPVFGTAVKNVTGENILSASSSEENLNSNRNGDPKFRFSVSPWISSSNFNPYEASLANFQSDNCKLKSHNSLPSIRTNVRYSNSKPSTPLSPEDVDLGTYTVKNRDSWSNEVNLSASTNNLSTNTSGTLKPSSLSSSRSSSYSKGVNSAASLQSIWETMNNSNPSVIPESTSSREPAARYRKISERNAVYDWNVIVDKIIVSNDQQSSIFLQQKLKISSYDMKQNIVDSIISQIHPLMLNRFGNFLVQRCFEHGTAPQIRQMGSAMLGNMLKLATDPFGCHVVQKAIDNVTEDIKLAMMDELFLTIDVTIMHHYACHVWQKLFETQWYEYPVNVMNRVNNALRGKWHEVAVGENGSLVVQNMFENCVEKDKRECIEEIIFHLDGIARGQWGNWVVQHMVENGQGEDLKRVIDALLNRAVEFSIDQFASKVIEKAIKSGPKNFISLYLKQITNARVDRTRQPLIDIASDQYGNYLIQQIIQLGQPAEKNLVITHIKKHMVSLRGSKYGQKVAYLVEKWKSQKQVSSVINYNCNTDL
ncbi:RNA-binding protein Mcp2 [Schizosaccharomyces pombe]